MTQTDQAPRPRILLSVEDAAQLAHLTPLSSAPTISSRRAGGVHVERPQRSEDERRGHRQAVEDDQQRRKAQLFDRFTYTDILTSSGRTSVRRTRRYLPRALASAVAGMHPG